MKVLGKYVNGNVTTTLFHDGTKIRCSKDDEQHFDFAENIDIKITNKCTGTNCAYCHEGSGPDGKQSDILHLPFIQTLHPFQEVALGGGNVFEYPDLIPLLEELKNKSVIVNITVNQVHFEQNIELLEKLYSESLIAGLGISLISPTDKFLDLLSKFKYRNNVVIHVINGIVNPDDLYLFNDLGVKLLILGYKHLRRGEAYWEKAEAEITKKQTALKNEIAGRNLALFSVFKTISFDNLAIEQLEIKKLLSEDDWNKYYMGDEGTSTFYIDCVEMKFAKNSTAPKEERYILLDNVDDMFHYIQEEKSTKVKEEE